MGVRALVPGLSETLCVTFVIFLHLQNGAPNSYSSQFRELF